MVARSLHDSDYHSWPESRRLAVSHYFGEVIAEILVTEGSGQTLDSWICALGRLHVDLAPFLTQVASSRSRLIEYYEVNSQPLMDGRLSNAFWEDAPLEQKQVIDWFQSAEIQKAIQEEYGIA